MTNDWIETLYREHGRKVFSFLWAMVGDRHAAEDLLHETFVRALQAAGQFEERARPSTWLFTIARNLALNYLRSRSQRKVQPLESAGEVRDTACDPSDTATGMCDAEMIRAAVSLLSEVHREVFLMKVVEGLSYRQIADIIGCPMGTVQSRFHHSVVRVRRILRKQGVTNELRSI